MKEAMDEQTRELIAIGASIGAHCQPCLTYHVTKAKEKGIDEIEIREAIVVGQMVEKGAMSAMRQFAVEIFDAPAATAGGCSGDGTSKGNGCCA